MKNTKSILTMLIIALPLASGCKQKASDEIDFGTVKNSVYNNKYFGLKLPLPAKWKVQDQESRAMLQETAGQLLSGDDKNMKAMIKASELSTVNLINGIKAPARRSSPFQPQHRVHS